MHGGAWRRRRSRRRTTLHQLTRKCTPQSACAFVRLWRAKHPVFHHRTRSSDKGRARKSHAGFTVLLIPRLKNADRDHARLDRGGRCCPACQIWNIGRFIPPAAESFQDEAKQNVKKQPPTEAKSRRVKQKRLCASVCETFQHST